MAESSNTESVHENMEKQSLEYGNGYNMTLFFCLWLRKHENCGCFGGSSLDHGYLCHSPLFLFSREQISLEYGIGKTF
jgi:hypothetical protein